MRASLLVALHSPRNEVPRLDENGLVSSLSTSIPESRL